MYSARNGKLPLNVFYTPDDSIVRSVANNIVSTLVRDNVEDRIVAAYNFVVQNIVYTSDKTNFGKSEWWQYPGETLGQVYTGSGNSRMYGDCEDSSFLFASLLIALGIPSSNVRVGLSSVHAWVECKINDVWYLFETTNDDAFESFIPASSVVKSDYVYDVKSYVYQGGCINV